jgi:hypothetical protein
MFDSARPEVAAFRELETLVRHLGDELAGFRRRALLAEARVRELEELDAKSANRPQRDLAARCTELERENNALAAKLDSATTRTRQMLERVRFIRQQTESSAAPGDR